MSILKLRERVIPVLWPLGKQAPNHPACWFTACAASVIPLTAAFHHLVFDKSRCILETHGRDYNLASVRDLFLKDPSLPWAIVAMVVVYRVGKKFRALRTAVVPAFCASLLFSLWLWDIPFSGRAIHRHWHDKHLLLPAGIPLSTKLFYILSLIFYLLLEAVLFLKRRRPMA